MKRSNARACTRDFVDRTPFDQMLRRQRTPVEQQPGRALFPDHDPRRRPGVLQVQQGVHELRPFHHRPGNRMQPRQQASRTSNYTKRHNLRDVRRERCMTRTQR